jgi:FlaA1/EpsC-like NDP-sugar epimerase
MPITGPLTDKNILVTGGTVSLGKTLIQRLLSYEMGEPASITVFSRDEGKQHQMMVNYQTLSDDALKDKFFDKVKFRIGDVRDVASLMPAVMQSQIIINTAALKQVPSCEYFPAEAVKTNILGAMNIVSCISDHNTTVDTVVCISTDKAAKPVNVMGMTKAVQERIFLQGSFLCPKTRFVAVRYGNVLASRGSVIPLFHDLINAGKDLTITDSRMTRFLLSLDDSVNLIFGAIKTGNSGDLYIPKIPSARMTDLAEVLIGDRDTKWVETEIRPGEKLHEILISEDEGRRAFIRDGFYVIPSSLPEIVGDNATNEPPLNMEYSSATDIMSKEKLKALLDKNGLLLESVDYKNDDELIR